MKRVRIIGNSVTLRVRPPLMENRESNKVYSSLLEEKLRKTGDWSVINMGLSRRIVEEFHESKDLFISSFPDYFIINLGCVDAPTREIPLWYSDIIYSRKNTNLYKPLNFFYTKVIKKYFRTALVKIRGKRPWVSKSTFKKSYDLMLNTLIKETNAQIIILGINRGNKRIDNILPGTIKNYKEYDNIIKELSNKDFVYFIDVSDLNSKDHFPDGIHYNHEGHGIVAQRIFKCINDIENGK